MSDILVVLPRRDASTAISQSLVKLTEAIYAVAPKAVGRGILGGRFGYGADFENEVFSMHTDGDFDCTCPDDHDPELNKDHKSGCPFLVPHFHHKATGFSVWWYKYIGRSMEVDNEPEEIDGIFSECMASLRVAHQPQWVTDYEKKMMSDAGPGGGAPTEN